MNKLLGFLVGIIDIIVALFNLIFTLIDGIIWIITNLPELLSGVMASFSYVPAFVLPFLTVSVAVMVVLMLIRLL